MRSKQIVACAVEAQKAQAQKAKAPPKRSTKEQNHHLAQIKRWQVVSGLEIRARVMVQRIVPTLHLRNYAARLVSEAKLVQRFKVML